MTKNRYFPTSVGSLRESTHRVFDDQGTASKVGELIDKHGSEKWLEPLIDELGPFIQLQLGDVANMLEVLNKSVLSLARKVFLLTITKLLPLEVTSKDCCFFISLCRLSSRLSLCGYGILYPYFLVSRRRILLLMLAYF